MRISVLGAIATQGGDLECGGGLDRLGAGDGEGAGLVTAGELIHCDFTPYANITRWLGSMKARPSYAEVYKVFNGFCESTKGQSFATL